MKSILLSLFTIIFVVAPIKHKQKIPHVRVRWAEYLTAQQMVNLCVTTAILANLKKLVVDINQERV